MTPESMPAIRRATPADAAALSELGARTFIETFGRLYPDEDLRDFLAQAHSRDWYAAALADPDTAFWIAGCRRCPVSCRPCCSGSRRKP